MFLKSRLVLICLATVTLAAGAVRADLSVILNATGTPQELKTWDFAGLGKLKSAASQEKNPATGHLAHYKGVLLSTVLEKAMADLPAERKAQVDLLIFKNAAGGQTLMPRSVVTKYPVLLALESGKTSVVMPWTSKSRIMSEDLPIESYFISDLTRIELGNYRERYSGVFLQRQTDPLAVRGEKIFLQNCVGCHSESSKPSLAELSGEVPSRRLASDGHPQVKGVPKLSERDRKALVNYLDAYRGEKSQKTASPSGSHAALGSTGLAAH